MFHTTIKQEGIGTRMKFSNMKMGAKFNLLITGIIVFLTIIIGTVSYFLISKAMEQVYTERVQVVSQLGYQWLEENYEGNWLIKDGQLYKGSTRINGNYEILDKIGEITNGAVTIFQGDTRVATNIIDNGQRAIDTKADPEVIEVVLKNDKEYIGKADILGETHLTMYKPLKNKDGETIGMWLVGPKIKMIQDTVFKLIGVIIGVILVSGIVAIIVSMFMTKAIVRPIKLINTQLKDISEGEGDLTRELSVNSKDEIGELASSFNSMLQSLRKMIEQISKTSEQVATSSEQLTASADETSQATNQVVVSIQEIAQGADNQEKNVVESSTAIKEMAIGIQQVADTTSTVSELAMDTNKEAQAGNSSIQKSIQQMNIINTSVKASADVIRQLGEQSIEIGQITEAITDIAEQTNLLALNAAIESARAGEHGKGFAVVADEVRKLAEQSKESADQITNLINQIQKDTSKAVDMMDKGTEEVSLGVDVVTDIGKVFNKILTSIEEVTSQIQEVSAVTEEISSGTQQVSASMEQMANISQNANRNTQHVASISEEQMASMREITSAAGSLSEMAESLQDLVRKFKI